MHPISSIFCCEAQCVGLKAAGLPTWLQSTCRAMMATGRVCLYWVPSLVSGVWSVQCMPYDVLIRLRCAGVSVCWSVVDVIEVATARLCGGTSRGDCSSGRSL
jgi:hypothetical protein